MPRYLIVAELISNKTLNPICKVIHSEYDSMAAAKMFSRFGFGYTPSHIYELAVYYQTHFNETVSIAYRAEEWQ